MHSPLQAPSRLQACSTPQGGIRASLTPPASCPPLLRTSHCASHKSAANGLSPCRARVAVSCAFSSNYSSEDAATDAAETLARARREAIDDVIEMGPSPQTLQKTAVASGIGVERSASPFNQSIAVTDRAVVAASAVRRSQAPRRGVILDAFASNTPAGGPASSPRASSARTATATRTSSRSTSYRRHGKKLRSLVVAQAKRLPAPPDIVAHPLPAMLQPSLLRSPWPLPYRSPPRSTTGNCCPTSATAFSSRAACSRLRRWPACVPRATRRWLAASCRPCARCEQRMAGLHRMTPTSLCEITYQ